MLLTLGEVAERCEDGEGAHLQALSALSVTFGDSSPIGRAKEEQYVIIK